MDAHSHWDQVYRTKGFNELSWFQPEATVSRNLIQEYAPNRNSDIIDIGAGSSTLVDGLLAEGYRALAVLDLSAAALEQTRQRLLDPAQLVDWIAGDVLTADFAEASFDVWHDRAVFHFLASAEDRARYVAQVQHGVRPGGTIIVATFADDGPQRCSGLEVARYSAKGLHNEFGSSFVLLHTLRDEHRTPWGTPQSFTYCVCRYEPRGDANL